MAPCRGPRSAPSLESPDDVIETMRAESDRGHNRASNDPDLMAFAGAWRTPFRAIPSSLRHHPRSGTGRFYAIEVNSGGNVWHFSSQRTAPWRTPRQQREAQRQFSSFDIAAEVSPGRQGRRRAEHLMIAAEGPQRMRAVFLTPVLPSRSGMGSGDAGRQPAQGADARLLRHDLRYPRDRDGEHPLLCICLPGVQARDTRLHRPAGSLLQADLRASRSRGAASPFRALWQAVALRCNIGSDRTPGGRHRCA